MFWHSLCGSLQRSSPSLNELLPISGARFSTLRSVLCASIFSIRVVYSLHYRFDRICESTVMPLLPRAAPASGDASGAGPLLSVPVNARATVSLPQVVQHMIEKHIFWTNYLVEAHEAANEADSLCSEIRCTYSYILFTRMYTLLLIFMYSVRCTSMYSYERMYRAPVERVSVSTPPPHLYC